MGKVRQILFGKTNFHRSLLALLLLIFFVIEATAQTSNPSSVDISRLGRPPIQNFDAKDGIPQSQVQAIAFDKKHYLWIGTADGAAYYNGHKWNVVDLHEHTNSNFINAIYPGSDGTIFFGTQGGLACLKDGVWTTYNVKSGLPDNSVLSVLQTVSADGSSIIWVGTQNGLARLEKGQWTIYNSSNSKLPYNTVWSLLETAINNQRKLWIGTEKGLASLEGEQWQIYNDPSILSTSSIRTILATSTANGTETLWVGTYGSGLARFENDKWTIYNTSNSGLPHDQVMSLLETPNKDGTNIIWLATNGGGLAQFENGVWKTYNKSNSEISYDSLYALNKSTAADGKSTIWIGTFGKGLSRLQLGKWLIYDSKTGLPDNGTIPILETNIAGKEIFWIGTTVGLARFKDGKWTTYNTENSPLPHNQVWSLAETVSPAGKHTLWIGTLGGLARLADESWTIYNTQNSALPYDFVLCLLATKSSTGDPVVWIGTEGGLARFENEQWTVYLNSNSGLPGNRIASLLATKSNTNNNNIIWVGTNGGGLARFENEKWQTYNTDNSPLPSNAVGSLMEIHLENGLPILFIGTVGGGLAQLCLDQKPERWLSILEQKKDSINKVVIAMCADRKGAYYLLTFRGIIRLTKPKVDLSKNTIEYATYLYSNDDGLPDNECNINGALLDSKGRIWASTIEGLIMLDPDREMDNPSSKPLYIERAGFSGTDQTLTTDTVLSYNKNNLTFEYALLSYFREAETRYQIQLVGFDEQPLNWTTEYKKDYTNLSAGDYTFQVWGRDYAGNITGPTKFNFRIKPAPWYTWWAYSLYFISFVSIVGGVFKWRIRKEQYRNEVLQQIVAERTAEVVKQRDEIKEQHDEIEEKNTHILDSIRYAERIQKAMLPHQESIAEISRDCFILFIPKDIVSGDFYWFHKLNDLTIIAVADCTGHGVPGAFMSMIGNSLLSQIVAEKHITDPATILSNLHNGISNALKQNELDTESQDGMDIAICCIDAANHKVIFAGSRRPFYYLDTNGELQMIKGDRRSIGGKQRGEEKPFTNHIIDYQNSITCYLTTDGYADQNGNGQMKFGRTQFTALLQQIAQLEMAQQQQALLDNFNQFKGTESQRDDITIIGLRF